MLYYYTTLNRQGCRTDPYKARTGYITPCGPRADIASSPPGVRSIVRTSYVQRATPYEHRRASRAWRCSISARTPFDVRTSSYGALAVPVRGPCELLPTSNMSTSSARTRELGETFSSSPRVLYEFKKSVRCSLESPMSVRTPCDFAKFRLKTTRTELVAFM